MNPMKFDAFLAEFPFLNEVFTAHGLEAQDCDGLTVKRLTPELLNSIPCVGGATGSLVGIEDGEYIAIVTPETVMVDVVRQSVDWIHNEAYTDNESWTGESVLEAIYRMQAENLTHVVVVESGYNVVNHYSQNDWEATIYKPSKEFTVRDLIAQAVEKAQAQVKAESEF